MRALGGAITSPCSNDSESRRHTHNLRIVSSHVVSMVCSWTRQRILRHSLGDCYVSSVFILACTVVTLIQKPVHCVLFSSCWQKGDRPDYVDMEPCSHPGKKKCSKLWTQHHHPMEQALPSPSTVDVLGVANCPWSTVQGIPCPFTLWETATWLLFCFEVCFEFIAFEEKHF